MNLAPLPIQRFVSNDNKPLVGGLLFTYVAGTTTKITTYTDYTGSSANTNPIQLDYRGECRLWIDPSKSYKFVLSPPTDTDPPSNPIWTVDNITIGTASTDNAAVDSGTANNVTLTIAGVSALSAFLRLVFKAAATNTGPVLLTLNGLPAKAVTWQNLQALGGGEIQQGGIYEVIYDGVQFQLQGPTLDPTQMITPGETAASVVPVQFAYFPEYALRLGKNPTPGTTPTDGILQKAIDVADLANPNIRFADQWGIAAPLLIRADSVQNLSFVGKARTTAIINPTVTNLSTSPQNVNAMFVNQADNGHLHFRHMRFYSVNAYTGQIFYSVQGGAADGSVEAAFSMVVTDCWHSLASTNTGYYRGGFSNLKCYQNVYENCKDGCWILEGAGNGDLQFQGEQVFICFDSYIRASDSNTKALLLIDDITAYAHYRGRLFDFNHVQSSIVSNVLFEPDVTSTNPGLGDIGIIRAKNSENLLGSNLSMVTRPGVPPGAVYMEFSGIASGSYSNCRGTANIGVLIPNNDGGGAPVATVMDLTFATCNFSGTATSPNATAAMQIGSASGVLHTYGSRFNTNTLNGVVSSAAGSWSWYSRGDEFLDAGVGGATSVAPLDLNTSGEVALMNARLGRTGVGATANWFMRANGSGRVLVVHPIISGAPPISMLDPTSTQSVTWVPIPDVVVIPYAGTMDLDATSGNVFIITATNGSAFTINNPKNAFKGMTLTIRIRNSSGGALGAVTWGPNFKLAAWTQPANTFSRAITFEYSGANWEETNRNTADIPI